MEIHQPWDGCAGVGRTWDSQNNEQVKMFFNVLLYFPSVLSSLFSSPTSINCFLPEFVFCFFPIFFPPAPSLPFHYFFSIVCLPYLLPQNYSLFFSSTFFLIFSPIFSPNFSRCSFRMFIPISSLFVPLSLLLTYFLLRSTR